MIHPARQNAFGSEQVSSSLVDLACAVDDVVFTVIVMALTFQAITVILSTNEARTYLPDKSDRHVTN